MSFPAQTNQFETVTETDRGHWSESLATTNGDLAVENTQKNGNSLVLSSNWNRASASIKTVDDLLASPYRKADTLQLSGNYDVPISESWSGYAGGGFNIATGSSASISDGYSLIASAGASYAVNPRLKFSIGLLTNNNFFNSLQAMPMIGLDWDITDRLKLRTLNGAFLSYDLGKSTEIDVSLQYLDQTFTVENLQGTVFMRMDSPVLVEESSIVGTLGVRHYWKDVFSIRAFAEIAGKREIQTPTPSEGIDIVEMPESDDQRISFGVEGGIRF